MTTKIERVVQEAQELAAKSDNDPRQYYWPQLDAVTKERMGKI